MARRKKTQRRRKKQGVSIIGMAETVALANVATNTLFNLNAYDFVFSKRSELADGTMTYGTGNEITLMELFSFNQYTGTQRQIVAGTNRMSNVNQFDTSFNLITENLKANWVSGVAGMVLVPAAFRIGKSFARPAISRANRLLGKAGVSSTIKV
tara:strand:- start:299 stop:760 length:462 start_codon:yes stop_codon:yes gene_type:complete